MLVKKNVISSYEESENKKGQEITRGNCLDP